VLDEVGDVHLLRIGQQADRAIDDFLLRLALGRLAGTLRGRLEMSEVVVVELEVQGDRHGGRPGERKETGRLGRGRRRVNATQAGRKNGHATGSAPAPTRTR
jgi:hypothetical protein